MDSSKLLIFLPQSLHRHLIPIVLGGIGIILILVGLIPSLSPKQKETGVVFEPSSAQSSDDKQSSEHEVEVAGVSTALKETMQVDVSGAILKPGVYSLDSETRVKDVIEKAGGFAVDANKEWIAKNLNLASKLHDEEKLYIPFEGEDVNTISYSSGQAGAMGNSGLININTASEEGLDSLPGVGPATAKKIIVGRPYKDVNELVDKKAVGQSVFEKIKEKVTVN